MHGRIIPTRGGSRSHGGVTLTRGGSRSHGGVTLTRGGHTHTAGNHVHTGGKRETEKKGKRKTGGKGKNKGKREKKRNKFCYIFSDKKPQIPVFCHTLGSCDELAGLSFPARCRHSGRLGQTLGVLPQFEGV